MCEKKEITIFHFKSGDLLFHSNAMNDIEEDLFSILNSFLSTNNKIRSESEAFYSELEYTNPDKMVNCLLSIINSNKKSYESLLALIKLERYIEDSASNLDCGISLPCLKKLRENYLSLLSDDSCSIVTRNYIFSVIENYIFITNGSENEWPELVPFFLSLLKEDKISQNQSISLNLSQTIDEYIEPNNNNNTDNNTNTNDNASTTDLDKNNCYLRSIAISFFTFFLIVRPTDDFDSLVRPYLNFNSPDEFERSSSLKFILISIYNKIITNSGNYNFEQNGNDTEKNFIIQLPQILTSLGHKYFSTNFSIFWKIFKKNEKIFSNILPDIVGLLITNASDPSNDELFRRESLFFFHRLFNFSKKCRKLINSDFIETIIKIISSFLQNPLIIPDLYEESRETINDILSNSCKKAYDENFEENDDKSYQYCHNALEIAQRYAEGSNRYVSSFYISFFRGNTFIEKVFQNASSNDPFVRENGFLSLKNRIENENRNDIGSFLFSQIQSKILCSSEIIDNHDELKDFVDLFCLWCQKSDKYDVQPFIKKIFDIIADHDSYLLLNCASVVCCKCHESSKYVLKKLMTRLMKNYTAKENEKDKEDENFIDSFKLSIVSNSYQCVDQNVAIESFQKILPLCINSSSSANIINSRAFLEIMEVIGYEFAPFLKEIIPHLFFLVRKSIDNILPVLDCFEKIVSLFSSSDFLSSFLDSILNFAISYGSKYNDDDEVDENKEQLITQMEEPDIQQIRLESIILVNLLLQNNWSNETLYGKCLQFVMVEIPNEASEPCLDALFSIVILFIEHEDESNIDKNGAKIPIIEMTKYNVLNYFLSYIPFAISNAIEKNSETLFASAASIFVLLLKRIPNETTQLFFQIQKLIPHYSIYSPPVTPPSSFTSPFSKNSTQSGHIPDFTSNYDNTSNSNELRCFSLMIWTDFVTFGPHEQTLQYEKNVIDDLKFYSEKVNPHKNKNEEHFRKIAIICLYSYYTAFSSPDSKMKKSDLEIETILDKFYRIASNVNSNSTEIIEASTAAFSVVLLKYVNEKIFVLRIKQMLNLLNSIKRQTDESDTIFNTLFQISLICLKNTDLLDFFTPLVDMLSNAIKRKLLSDSAVDDITQNIIDLGDKAPPKLKSIIQI